MSKTRCANTVPTSVGHAPLRPGIFRVRTATRASSPIRPGSTAFANRPTEKAEKTSGTRGRGGSIAEWITSRPGERASDYREEVQRDRNGDPLPAHGSERAADRGEGAAPPPEQAGERREDDEPQERHAGSGWTAPGKAGWARNPSAPLSSAARCAFAPRTIARSSVSRCRRSARSRRSRSTSSPTPRSSVTSAGRRSRRSASPAPSSPGRSRSSTSSRTGRRRSSRAPRARAGRTRPPGSRRRRSGSRSGSGSLCSSSARSSPSRSSRASAATATPATARSLYFRIAALGLPAALVALAGQGYLRGVSNLRRPLEIVVVANVANLVLEVLFVYVFHWGIAGSAAGTAIAQAGMGVAFVVELLRPHAPSQAAEPAAR